MMKHGTHFIIQAKRMDYLFSGLASGIIAIFMTLAVLFLVLKNQIDADSLSFWMIVNLIILSLRTLLFFFYKKSTITPENIKTFFYVFYFLAMLTAISLGSSALFIFPQNVPYQMVLVFMIITLTAGGSISLGSYIDIFNMYILFILAPFIYVFSLSDVDGFKTLAFVLFVYMLLLSLLTKKVSQSINKNIILAYQNDDLLTKLQEKTDMANKERDKANELANVKSKFLSNMSHELRTPLNSIIGFSQVLQRSKNIPDKEKNYIDKINLSGAHLLKLINSILDLSKIEVQGVKLEKTEIDLYKLANEIIHQLAPQASAKKLEMILHYNNDTRNYMADGFRIAQVLTNTLSNAIKFTQKGTITLSIEKLSEQKIRFEVKDSGIGLTPEQITRLFQPFSQADNSTTREYGGTGLGLVISKEIVAMMDGRIWVESQIGTGSSFIFEVNLDEIGPKCDLPFHLNLESDTLEQRVKALNATILLAEDSKTNQYVIIGMLDESNIHVDVADNGQEAIEMFRAKKYDLILMDLQMPLMNGYEACKIIRELDATVPILALSADVMQEDINKAIAVGMNAHLCKPLELHVLYSALLQYIKTP